MRGRNGGRADNTAPALANVRGSAFAAPADMRAVVLVTAGALLTGCGLLLGGSDLPVPDYIASPNTAEQVEGEVRDESTLAPVADAEVVLETDRAGYRLARRADAGGRFAIGYSSLLRRISGAERLVERVLFGGGDTDSMLVSRVTIRARAGARCSPPVPLERRRDERVLLLVGDCARYEPRSAASGAPPR